MNLFRRLPLSRLLLLCTLAVVIGISATALAFALGGGPTPPPQPLATAVHDALAAEPVQGLSANITYTNHLLEGASLASGGGTGAGGPGGGGASELASSPLLTGASGRLWVTKDRVRLELQSEKGDTEVIYDGHTITIYDAATNTVYRYTPKQEAVSQEGGATGDRGHEAPSLAQIEEAIANIRKHANLSGATPTDVAGQPAYTVRLSPQEGGSLIGGAELSFDAKHGLPLRTAVYSSTSAAPVIELAATEVQYGPVESSVFSFTPPPGAKVEELVTGGTTGTATPSGQDGSKPTVTTHGSGITGIAVLENTVKPGSKGFTAPEGLPKVDINGTSASELRTALGTILTFERSGVRYVLAGAVDPATVEAVAKGL